jgi:hypothetical protein
VSAVYKLLGALATGGGVPGRGGCWGEFKEANKSPCRPKRTKIGGFPSFWTSKSPKTPFFFNSKVLHKIYFYDVF